MIKKLRLLAFTSYISIVALLFSQVFIQGCAEKRTSSVTKTELSHDVETESPRARYQNDGAVTSTETKTVEVEEHTHGSSGLFSIVGEIIALPFRAVGALFSAIF